MLRAIIIDDERLARERVKSFCLEHPSQLQVIGQASSGQEAIDQIEDLKPALIFLDIHLQDMNGFEVLDRVSYQPLIIFTTAYDEYAIRAFDNMAIDYLLKPITSTRFAAAINKLATLNEIQKNGFWKEWKMYSEKKEVKKLTSIAVKKGNKIILVDMEDIVLFKSEDKCVVLSSQNGIRHILDQSLTDLEKRLPDHFIRGHRSFIFNRKFLLEMERYFKGTLILTLNDKNRSRLKTGETYSKEVKVKLGVS